MAVSTRTRYLFVVKVSSSPMSAREPTDANFCCLSGEKYCLLHCVSQRALIPAADFCSRSVAVSRASEGKA